MLAGWLALTVTSSQAQISLNVTNYGARGDAVQFFVNTKSNSVVITTTNKLTSSDIGKTIEVFRVGKITSGVNSYNIKTNDFQDVIATITNVVMGTNLYLSVKPQDVTTNYLPQLTANNVFATYGTDNTPAFSNVLAAASSYTNVTIYIPNGTYLLMPIYRYWPHGLYGYAYGSIIIRRGGLHFLGESEAGTILLSRGAWRIKNTADGTPYDGYPFRGFLFELSAPITNDYSVILENLTLDGGVQKGNLDVHGIACNPVDGLGWDQQHSAYLTYDDGSNSGTATHQMFTNVTVQHWRGEMFKSIDENANGNISIRNSTFKDGCATALNIYGSWDVTSNRFENILDVFEYYQEHYTNTSYFRNNFVTNTTGNGTSWNGAVWTAPQFIFQSNVCYFGAGNGLGFTPGANISVLNNEFHFASNAGTAFAVGTAGSQGVNGQYNSNILISCNLIIFPDKASALLSFGGGGILAVSGLTFCSNTVTANSFDNLIWAASYSKNLRIDHNDTGNAVARFHITADGGGLYPLIESNNIYKPWPTYFEAVQTNTISYSSGPKQYMDYVATSNIFVLNDIEGSQIPAGAYLDIDNRTNRWAVLHNGVGGDVIIRPSQTKVIDPVLVKNGTLRTFYWNGSAWTTNRILTKPPSPPSNLRLVQ